MKLSVKVFKFIVSQPDFMTFSRNQLYRLVSEYLTFIDSSYNDGSVDEDYLVAVIRDYRLLVISQEQAYKMLEAK